MWYRIPALFRFLPVHSPDQSEQHCSCRFSSASELQELLLYSQVRWHHRILPSWSFLLYRRRRYQTELPSHHRKTYGQRHVHGHMHMRYQTDFHHRRSRSFFLFHWVEIQQQHLLEKHAWRMQLQACLSLPWVPLPAASCSVHPGNWYILVCH